MAQSTFRLSLAYSIFFLLYATSALSARGQSNYEQACLSNVDNATVVLPASADVSLPNGEQMEARDTLAVYNDQGTCVGYEVWAADGTDLALAAAGPNEVDAAQNGLAVGESLKFEVYDVSSAERFDLRTNVVYKPCNEVGIPLCRSDGAYRNGALFVVSDFSEESLPVELSSFKVQREGRRAILTWSTASEDANAGFDVQHRPKGDSTWTTLSFVEGQGTTTQSHDYRFRTTKLPYASHSFRLRQVDRDGTTTLSDIVSVELTLDEAFALSGVYPNPVRSTGKVDVTVREAQNVSVQLYNLLGRRVATVIDRKLEANRTETIRVDFDRLPSGVYLLRVRGRSFAQTRRVSVVR
jgi:hypothetical protein